MKIWLLDHIMKGTLSPVGQHTSAFPFWVEQLLPVPLHPLRWAGSAGLWGKSPGPWPAEGLEMYQSMFVSPCTTLESCLFLCKTKTEG